MAKMSRKAFKAIVKECLVEIFTELNEPQLQKKSTLKQRRITEERRLDRMRKDLDRQSAQEEFKIEQTVGQVTNDPLLSMILTDTASTTLVEQIDADRHGPSTAIGGGAAALAAAQGDPMDMFGDVADNWAALAFAEKKGM